MLLRNKVLIREIHTPSGWNEFMPEPERVEFLASLFADGRNSLADKGCAFLIDTLMHSMVESRMIESAVSAAMSAPTTVLNSVLSQQGQVKSDEDSAIVTGDAYAYASVGAGMVAEQQQLQQLSSSKSQKQPPLPISIITSLLEKNLSYLLIMSEMSLASLCSSTRSSHENSQSSSSSNNNNNNNNNNNQAAAATTLSANLNDVIRSHPLLLLFERQLLAYVVMQPSKNPTQTALVETLLCKYVALVCDASQTVLSSVAAALSCLRQGQPDPKLEFDCDSWLKTSILGTLTAELLIGLLNAIEARCITPESLKVLQRHLSGLCDAYAAVTGVHSGFFSEQRDLLFMLVGALIAGENNDLFRFVCLLVRVRACTCVFGFCSCFIFLCLEFLGESCFFFSKYSVYKLFMTLFNLPQPNIQVPAQRASR